LLDDDGEMVSYVPLDPPLGGFPPSLSLTFEHDSDDSPTIVLTEAPSDPGEAEVLYTFAALGSSATPTP
jgi:hypothetical protein